MKERQDIQVSRASEAHIEDVSSLRERFWTDQKAKGLLEAAPDVSVPACQKLLGRPRTHVLVAAQADGVVSGYLFGQTKLVPGDPPVRVSSVEEVYVDETARSGGVAARLVQTALSAFESDGAERIQLRILDQNQGAFAFWKKIGFQPYLSVFEYSKGDHK